MRFRVKGADVVRVLIFIFFDSYCECNVGWLEFFLDRIKGVRFCGDRKGGICFLMLFLKKLLDEIEVKLYFLFVDEIMLN